MRAVPQTIDLPPQRGSGPAPGRAARGHGIAGADVRGGGGSRPGGVEEVGDRLGLREVQLALKKGAARELAGLGEARARGHARREQSVHHHRAAMTLQLEHRLARIRVRLGEIQRDAFVERLAAHVPKNCMRRMPRFGQTADDASGDPRSAWA